MELFPVPLIDMVYALFRKRWASSAPEEDHTFPVNSLPASSPPMAKRLRYGQLVGVEGNQFHSFSSKDG